MRSLEEHLSPQELAGLPRSPESLVTGTPDQQLLSRHLQQCGACASLARAHWSLRRLAGAPDLGIAGDPCPLETIWLELAADLHPEQAAALFAHAAGCAPCADQLREAMEILGDDQLGAEPLESLVSSTPEWQRRIAAQMAATSVVPKPPKRLLLFSSKIWIALSAAAALIIVSILGGIALWRAGHPSNAQLLARAYNKQRMLPLRIPGAEPVPLSSFTRGATDGLSDPTELLELRLRAQQHLDETPNSPYWHQVMGEVNLLELDGLAARRNLEIAQTLDEHLPNLQIDLAAAWFEIGRKSGNAEAYAEAAEIYSKELNGRPADPALLYYNRALCWEGQNLIENALKDLHSALAAERSAEWRKAIEAEINRLSTHSATQPIDGFESALDEATTKFLPRWAEAPDARAQIAEIASLGLKHRDRWLQDWIDSPHTQTSQEADRDLAAAVIAGNAGEPETSLAESRHAIKGYSRSSDRPGLVRARLAETYALQRLTRTQECLEKLTHLVSDPNIKDYSWIQSRASKVEADCQGMSHDFHSQRISLEHTISLSTTFNFPVLHMRTLGAQIGMLQGEGLNLSAWRMISDELQQCHFIRCSAITEYSFLYSMVESAQSLNLPHVALEIMQISTDIAQQSGNATTYAYALETLGTLAGRLENYDTAVDSFRRASSVAHAGNQGPMTAIYQADWQTDQAEILCRRGRYTDALHLLQQNGPTILSSGYQTSRLHYLQQLTVAQASLREDDDALITGWKSVYEAERSLPSLGSASEREHWQAANQMSYTELVKLYLRRGDADEALQAWERFRSAPYALHISHTSGIFLDGRTTAAADARVVILARVGDSYVGWVANASPLHVLSFTNLGPVGPLLRLVTTFYRLCADPNSNLADLKTVGARVYNTLIQPIIGQVRQTGQIWIEIDPSLEMLPLTALTLPDGNWLGAQTQLTVLPAWWTIRPEISLAEITVTPAMHLVAVSGFDDQQTVASEVPEIARLFQNAMVLQGPKADQQTVLHALLSAELFHFSGHGSTSSDPRIFLSSSKSLTPDALGHDHLRRCKVGVLAACNGAAADPDEMEKNTDLRDALTRAGVSSVVAGTWDVDDRSTRSLMLTFYKQLVLGSSTAKSLQVAQQVIRLTNYWKHPYYWASFELFDS